MELLTDMKTKIKHAVDYAYKFDTGRSSDSISRNVTRAQALLAETAFIYRVRLIVHRIFSQLSTAIWFTGFRHWQASTFHISTSHNPGSCQSHVVQEHGRRRHCLSL